MAIKGGTICGIRYREFQNLDAYSDTPIKGRKICSSCRRYTAAGGKAGKKSFYQSWEWKKLRYQVLMYYGAKCMLCGSDHRIVVDHIKPRKKYPELELDFDNMQVLCNECNRGKGRWDETDHRPHLTDSQVVELVIVREAKDSQ